MSFILSYETNVTADLFNLWDNIFVSVEIEDDLGNKYTSLNGLNYAWRTDLTENWNATYDQLDARAKTLYLTLTGSVLGEKNVNNNVNNTLISILFRH